MQEVQPPKQASVAQLQLQLQGVCCRRDTSCNAAASLVVDRQALTSHWQYSKAVHTSCMLQHCSPCCLAIQPFKVQAGAKHRSHMDPPEPRLYRFAVWHKSAPQGWIAQVPTKDGKLKQRTVGSVCATQMEAAKLAANALHRSVASLERQKPAKPSARRASKSRKAAVPKVQVSGCKYVYWHTASRRWEVRVSGQTLGYHTTHEAAAAEAA